MFYVHHFLNPVRGIERHQLDKTQRLSSQVSLELTFQLNIAPFLCAGLRLPVYPYLFASDASGDSLDGRWRPLPQGFDIFAPVERSSWFSKHKEDTQAWLTPA